MGLAECRRAGRDEISGLFCTLAGYLGGRDDLITKGQLGAARRLCESLIQRLALPRGISLELLIDDDGEVETVLVLFPPAHQIRYRLQCGLYRVEGGLNLLRATWGSSF